MSEQNRPSTFKSRLVLVTLIVVFFTPVISAILLNSRWVDWQPPPTRNYGQLIEPAVAPPPALLDELPDGSHWTLLTAVRKCADACARNIDLFDRIDRALGRHGDTLELVIVVDGGHRSDLPETVTMLADRGRWRAYLETNGQATGSVVLIDPRGNLIMSFPPDYDPSGVRNDLERLIKYSRFDT